MLRAISGRVHCVVSLTEDGVFIRTTEKGLLRSVILLVRASRCFLISRVRRKRMSALAGMRRPSALEGFRKSRRRAPHLPRWLILIQIGRFRVLS